jgi:hypothetical protein
LSKCRYSIAKRAQLYYSFAQTERHFGLGSRDTVDVSVEFYPSGKTRDEESSEGKSAVLIVEKRRRDEVLRNKFESRQELSLPSTGEGRGEGGSR